jgi:hypothetical protein
MLANFKNILNKKIPRKLDFEDEPTRANCGASGAS